MPSTTSSSVSRLFASSTVITPSLPTFCIAFDCFLDTTPEVHGIEPGGHRFHALSDDGVSENCCCRRAVTRLIAGLLRYLADHLGAHVLELVSELDLLGDGDAVLGDA